MLLKCHISIASCCHRGCCVVLFHYLLCVMSNALSVIIFDLNVEMAWGPTRLVQNSSQRTIDLFVSFSTHSKIHKCVFSSLVWRERRRLWLILKMQTMDKQLESRASMLHHLMFLFIFVLCLPILSVSLCIRLFCCFFISSMFRYSYATLFARFRSQCFRRRQQPTNNGTAMTLQLPFSIWIMCVR